jgi:hypothetical protein
MYIKGAMQINAFYHNKKKSVIRSVLLITAA